MATKKPTRTEKGLQEIASRDGFRRPVFLAPLLHDPMLNEFEPDHLKCVPAKTANPGKDWVKGLNALGGNGTVTIGQNVVQVKQTTRIDWADLRNLVLFRYRCRIPISAYEGVILDVRPSIPYGLEDAGMMDKKFTGEGGDDTVSEGGESAESDLEMRVDDGTEPEDG